VKTSILKTLAYFAVFNFPLTKDELWNYLIEISAADKVIYETILDDLVSVGRVIRVGESYYTLPQIDPVDRVCRYELSQSKINEAREIFRGIGWWPFLKAVLVTGSVAALNATDEGDIDVLIITSKDTLWLTRVVVVCYLLVKGVYRKIICPNIWLTEDFLEWSSHDLHSAFDAVLAKPVINKKETHQRFLQSNTWVKLLISNSLVSSTDIKVEHATPLHFWVKPINNLLFRLEGWFMSGKQTLEEVSYNRIHFKKNDNKERILTIYNQLITNV